jgi:hypothetical protein
MGKCAMSWVGEFEIHIFLEADLVCSIFWGFTDALSCSLEGEGCIDHMTQANTGYLLVTQSSRELQLLVMLTW